MPSGGNRFFHKLLAGEKFRGAMNAEEAVKLGSVVYHIRETSESLIPKHAFQIFIYLCTLFKM